MAKILAVDDDAHLLAVMQEWLTHEQHLVDAVGTGLDCWEHLQTAAYDLVILDWDLPDINGVDLLKRYRTAGGTTPVLMLTGRTSVDDKAEGLDSGADDYITKPFHMKELFARIRAALRKGESLPPPKPLATSNQELLNNYGLVGTSLAARYEFIDVLGEGGVGVVFKARHPILDKLVAVKMIQKNELNEEIVARFETEARAISHLDHPNIATVYDYGVTERRQPFMVMEFIEGKTLDQVMRERGLLSFEEALDILIQICDGMSHAHKIGILHRDLKSSNLMLKEVAGSPDVLKILDFGCAKLRGLRAQKSQALTYSGEIVGSPLYISPEQIHGKDADERSDVYSLGCVIYEVLTDCVPHVAEDAIATMVKHVSEDVLPLHQACPNRTFPHEMDQVVSKVLEKDPEKRYQSMCELRTDLEQLRRKVGLKGSTTWWQRLVGPLVKKLKPSATADTSSRL